jgi:hypothetical protein
MRHFIFAGLVGALARAAALAFAVVPLVSQRVGSVAATASGAPGLPYPERSLLGARQWLNTPPLSAADLRGRVGAGEFLDLFLHQQPEGAALRSGLGR